MVNVTEVAERVYRFETPAPGMYYTPVVYLIHQSKPVLIEPGPAVAISSIQEAMAHLGIEDLSYIILTHIHLDHGGGVGMLAQLFPGAKVVVHPRGAKHLVSPSRLIDSFKAVWGDDFEVHFGPFIPVPESQLRIPEDGEAISIDDRELQIIYAPGHAPHHMVIFDRKLNSLFCGEALGLPGHQLPPVAPYSFDLDTYLDTIERLRQLEMEMLFYSHGGVEREPRRLISIASENARVCADTILEALKKGEMPEEIGSRIGDYLKSRFGLEVDKTDLEIAVAGYTIYFRSRGLV